MLEWNYLGKILWSSRLLPIGWSFSWDPSVGSQLDLLQVELTSFLASGASYLGRDPSERRSRYSEFFVPRQLNQTKNFLKSLAHCWKQLIKVLFTDGIRSLERLPKGFECCTHNLGSVFQSFRGLFNKTFTSVIYKCSYCFQTLKQWLHL